MWTVFENGPAATKVDLLLLGEGYTEAELPKFHADVTRLVEVMFSVEPYKSRRSDFNVRAIDLPTAQSGAHNPRTGEHRRTPLGVTYNVFDSERYAMSLDNRGWRDVAAAAPYDAVEILINNRYYGGGGIFNDHATVAVDTGSAEYIFVHEFGHHFAALGDEYYTSDVAYETGGEKIEPWEPNVTALRDPATLKWKDLVAAGTPLPTPWEKDAVRNQVARGAGRTPPLARGGRAGGRDGHVSSPRRKRGKRPSSPRRPTRRRSARSKARPTNREASTARKPTASCSRATMWGSAASAGAPSSA